MNDEQTTEPNIEEIEDQNNEAKKDLSKDKVTGDISRVILPCQIWMLISTLKILPKILSNDNKKTGVSRKMVCFGILIHILS